jgi:hypothetical protein
MRPTTKDRERRFRLRLRRNVMLGVVLGLVFGSGIGALLGVWAFAPGSRGMWASIVGGTIFGFILGAFEGGMSALESPQPGREPSQVEHPLRDVSDLTQREGESDRDNAKD